MAMRYVVTSRIPGAEVSLPEDDQVTVVAPLDRGLLVDAEPERAEAMADSGLRVKALPDPHVINLFTYRIDTESGTLPEVPEALRGRTAGEPDSESESEAEAGEPDLNHLVQLVGPAQESWLAVLAERGVRVVEPVGPFAYYVRADAATVAALEGLPFVDWAGRLEPAYKVNPVLLAPEREAEADGLGAIEALDIGVLADGDVDGVAHLVSELGGTVRAIAPPSSDAFRSITAEVPQDQLGALARRDDVRWVDAVRTPVPEDERTAQIAYEDLNGAAAPNTSPVLGYAANLTALGADGSGVTIAICDTGVDTNDPATVHADLAGRLAFAVDATGAAPGGADTDGHGTHVAGIAGGSGGSGDVDPQGFTLGLGLATDADIGCVVFNGTPQQRIATSVQNGASVMNNSYALNGANYTAADRTFDLGVRDADPATTDVTQLVVVFSAGNSGPGAMTCTKAVKNAFVVGNSLNFRPGEGAADDIRGVNGTSSRGPAGDGRMLPNLVAPGTDVVSARSGASARPQYVDTGGTTHANHTRMGGTSMAAPVVSGMCAVLIDWWRQTRGGATPSPALLRALLVACTEPVAGGPNGNGGNIAAGPTNDAGWGRVSLENSLLQAPASDRGPKIFLDQRHAFTATGQEYRVRVGVADPARPLRIALAWTDAAGAVGANPALVNDLDLEVVEVATGNLYRGNVFAGGFSTTGGAADARNNIEGVAIQNPDPNSVYEVTVVAANVAASARPDIATPWQDFGLVIDNATVPSAAPVSVVTVLDRSGSMAAFGYIDVTRQTSRQFIDLLSIDDSVGVVSFGDAAAQEFPAAGPPQVIVGDVTKDAATAAVDGIAFGGCTFMGAGITAGGAMLAGATTARSLVLLSDGYDNKGCDPTNPAKPSALDAAAALPADLPIYTCAMGPASDQNLLGQLAADTDGRYYFMPTIDDLFEIYNYIRGQVTGDGIIVNESSAASRSVVSGFVDACAESVLFTVAWHDPGLTYVPRDPAGPNEISVRLRSPGGRWLPYSATEFHRTVGDGYVSFDLQSPQPGAWTVEVATDRPQHTPYTVGGFVRSDIDLRLQAPVRVSAGRPIDVLAAVRDGRGPVSGLKVAAAVAAPRRPIGDVLLDHADQLRKVRLPAGYKADGKPDKGRLALARLVLLRDRLVATTGDDILAPVVTSLSMSAPSTRLPGTGPDVRVPVTRPVTGRRVGVGAAAGPAAGGAATAVGGAGNGVATGNGVPDGAPPATTNGGSVIDMRNVLRPRQKGVVVGRVTRTMVPGSYSIAVTASGFSQSCRSRFVRHDLLSVVVDDPS
jgi:subtilisin family serine protease/Mg-chelatase subunit ChlD